MKPVETTWASSFHSAPFASGLLSAFLALAGLAGAAGVLSWHWHKPITWLPGGIKRPLSPDNDEGGMGCDPDALKPWGALCSLCLVYVIIMVWSWFVDPGSGFADVTIHLAKFKKDIVTASGLIAGASRTGTALLEDLDRLYVVCSQQVQDALGASLTEVVATVKSFQYELGNATQVLSAVPPGLKRISRAAESMADKLPLWSACAVLAQSVVLAASAVALGATHMGHLRLVRRYGPDIMPWLIPVATAFGVLALCWASAAELRAANEAASWCWEDQDDVLASTATSKSSFISFTATGRGQNELNFHLEAAQANMLHCLEWTKSYQFILEGTCHWAPGKAQADVAASLSQINQTKELLRPERFYPYWKAAIHDTLCRRVPSLTQLAFLHLVLGMLCVPGLAFLAYYLLEHLSSEPRFHQLRQDDLEDSLILGDKDAVISEEVLEEEDFNPLYHVVFFFSSGVLLCGAFLYFLPEGGYLRPALGTLLMVSGTFLMTNADLLVTMLRLSSQVSYLKLSNVRFNDQLQNEAKEVRRLTSASKGLKEIDSLFGGEVQKATKELEKLELTARVQVSQCVKELCQLYCDQDGDRKVSKGPEMDAAIEVFVSIFGGLIRDLCSERIPKLLQGLDSSTRLQTEGQLTLKDFAVVMEKTIASNNVNAIPSDVAKLLDKQSLI